MEEGAKSPPEPKVKLKQIRRNPFRAELFADLLVHFFKEHMIYLEELAEDEDGLVREFEKLFDAGVICFKVEPSANPGYFVSNMYIWDGFEYRSASEMLEGYLIETGRLQENNWED